MDPFRGALGDAGGGWGSAPAANIITLTKPGAIDVGQRETLGLNAVKVVIILFAAIGVVFVLNHTVERIR